MDRIIPRSRLTSLANRLRRSGKQIVFTNGVFDILHRGHVQYLERARSYGDLLIVGLNSDASVRRIKGPGRPVQTERDRAIILQSLRSVDYVVLFGEDTPERTIQMVRPSTLVKGADYKEAEIVGASFVKSYGGKVRRVRLTPGRSTSRIIRRSGASKKSR
jgi:D-beta-D-heptose 7-phosphate kinase/D-beta-D-heptose 1-phosphate adenosyltransferase